MEDEKQGTGSSQRRRETKKDKRETRASSITIYK